MLFSATPCSSRQLSSSRTSPTAWSLPLFSLSSTGSLLVSSVPVQKLLFPTLPVWLQASWLGPPVILSSSSSGPSYTALTPPNTTSSFFLTIAILHPLPLPRPPFLLLARAPVAATSFLPCLLLPLFSLHPLLQASSPLPSMTRCTVFLKLSLSLHSHLPLAAPLPPSSTAKPTTALAFSPCALLHPPRGGLQVCSGLGAW